MNQLLFFSFSGLPLSVRGTVVVLSRGGVVASLRVGVVSGSLCIRHLVTIRVHVLFSEALRRVCMFGV